MNPFQKPITTSLSPNTQFDDVLLALGTLLQPAKWSEGRKIEALESKFKDYLGLNHAISFESGRTCLFSILTSLELDEGDEVAIQSYTCVAVPEPILWTNLKPVYVDIDIHTLNMSAQDLEKKITPKTKAIIIQHTFGNPSGLDQLIKIAKKHKLIIIEDCAHALGAEYEDQKAGTFGDLSFFSFGRDKVISSVFGGTVMTNNSEYAEKINRFKEEKCKYPPKKWTAQQLLHPIIFASVKPLYTFFSLGKIILEVSKRLGITSKAVYSEEKRGEKPHFIQKKLPNAMAILALHQFQKLEKVNKNRIKLAEFYNEQLTDLVKSTPNMSIVGNEENKKLINIYLRLTLLIENPQTIHAKMKHHNIYLGDWYNDAIAPKGVNYKKIYYDPVTCPNAEKAAAMTINLPTHIGITKKDAQKIVRHLKEIINSN